MIPMVIMMMTAITVITITNNKSTYKYNVQSRKKRWSMVSYICHHALTYLINNKNTLDKIVYNDSIIL